MLSRLISLLRRIPAVKWAFTRLRPLPHGGSIDVAPDTADASPALVAETAEATPALDTSISADASHCGAAVAASAAEDDTASPVIAESRSEAPAEVSVSDDSFWATLTEVEPVVVEEASVATIDVECKRLDLPELVTNSAPSSELAADAEPVVAEASSVRIELAPVDAPALVVNGAHSSVVDLSPRAAEVSADTPSAVTIIEPAPALVSPALEVLSAPKSRPRAAEPADRAGLIRQRWTETGIRMWNPQLHGAGDATLNIQGSVGLLPPAPGETMPRYDKLEFRMLGGQIVCEGVIVEAPVQAGHRSFTSLADAGKLERVREPVRERQAALT